MRESSQAWKPKSSGTSGELAMAKALQDAKIPYRFQVPVKTKFHEWSYLCDFVIPSSSPKKYLGLVVEVNGMLHYRTWKGKPALKRMAKDEVKKNCLIEEGYRFLAFRDSLIKKEPQSIIMEIRKELQR